MKTLRKQSVMLVAAFATAQLAFAAGPGASANVRTTAPTTGPGMNVGAAADADPSAKALENANGQFIEDRKFGQDRAQEQRSAQGTTNEKATEALEEKASASASDPGKAGATASTSPSISSSPTASGKPSRRK